MALKRDAALAAAEKLLARGKYDAALPFTISSPRNSQCVFSELHLLLLREGLTLCEATSRLSP